MSLLSQARSHYDVCYKVILAYVLETLDIMRVWDGQRGKWIQRPHKHRVMKKKKPVMLKGEQHLS